MERRSTRSSREASVSLRRRSSEETLKRYRKKRRARRALALLGVVSLLVVAILMLANNVPVAPASSSVTSLSGWQDLSDQVLFDGEGADPPEEVIARNVYVVCLDDKEVVFDRQADEEVPPASTTKMATALTAMDVLGLDDEVRVGDEINMIVEGSSRAWLSEGDVLTVRQLLIALLVPSGNDAAYTLATHAGREILGDEQAPIDQAIKAFMNRVNTKAESLGLRDSHFIVPDGYDAEGQYSTAHDLAVLAKACLDNPVIAEIVGTFESVEYWESGETATLYNTNELINPESPYYMPEAVGVKTGNSELAGSCLVSAAHISGKTYISVVMGSGPESRFLDSVVLFDAAANASSEA